MFGVGLNGSSSPYDRSDLFKLGNGEPPQSPAKEKEEKIKHILNPVEALLEGIAGATLVTTGYELMGKGVELMVVSEAGGPVIGIIGGIAGGITFSVGFTELQIGLVLIAFGGNRASRSSAEIQRESTFHLIDPSELRFDHASEKKTDEYHLLDPETHNLNDLLKDLQELLDSVREVSSSLKDGQTNDIGGLADKDVDSDDSVQCGNIANNNDTDHSSMSRNNDDNDQSSESGHDDEGFARFNRRGFPLIKKRAEQRRRRTPRPR